MSADVRVVSQPVTLAGAANGAWTVSDGRLQDASDTTPHVDLRGATVMPGLINAHDHLSRNVLPRLELGVTCGHINDWIPLAGPHLEAEPYRSLRTLPKNVLYRHGALKNLLAGVTCVAHHDRWDDFLHSPDFPVRVARTHWSHSLCYGLGDPPPFGPPVVEAFRAAGEDGRWVIHLAEGHDAAAEAELAELDRLGCLDARTVLVHGVGLTESGSHRVIEVGAAVVWCPASNLLLLGRTLDPKRLAAAGRLALGSDSRFTGSRDLLEELRVAAAVAELDRDVLERLVTTDAARIVGRPELGTLAAGAPADLVILPEGARLGEVSRADLQAVVLAGVPRITAPELAEWFALCGITPVRVRLDGVEKLCDPAVLEPRTMLEHEPGLEALT